MESTKLLRVNHPSYDCEQAWFLFAMTVGGQISRLLLVEAKNVQAVQTIERIVGYDGHVSTGCELLTVHRQCPSIGIRSDLVSETDYVDFMIDVVDPARIISDPLTAKAFQDSLTLEDREQALQKMDESSLPIKEDPPDPAPAPAPAPALAPAPEMAKVIPIRGFDPAESRSYQDVMAALTDLGYKKAQAKKAVDALGSRVDEMGLEDAIKVALQSHHKM